MEKEFTFETDYDISALSAMARALRKTVRKKQSRRSRIFGWTVAVLGILYHGRTGDQRGDADRDCYSGAFSVV